MENLESHGILEFDSPGHGKSWKLSIGHGKSLKMKFYKLDLLYL